jgi:hypothetical protein
MKSRELMLVGVLIGAPIGLAVAGALTPTVDKILGKIKGGDAAGDQVAQNGAEATAEGAEATSGSNGKFIDNAGSHTWVDANGTVWRRDGEAGAWYQLKPSSVSNATGTMIQPIHQKSKNPYKPDPMPKDPTSGMDGSELPTSIDF